MAKIVNSAKLKSNVRLFLRMNPGPKLIELSTNLVARISWRIDAIPSSAPSDLNYNYDGHNDQNSNNNNCRPDYTLKPNRNMHGYKRRLKEPRAHQNILQIASYY
ncbi:unnamed protein product [Hymenolepis diminuta]|uniref:Uncharacterized protein n=1 Tax=Hymenolepis diminuta TaxID=6216 RepID=A0A564YDN7_HYMDI|nr:unnamed protein product [Hymenolepis diminuta]